jgi:hypothetical protein
MGTTLLEVANRALSRLGALRITALTDTTASAMAVSACFPGVPDWVLRSWKWRLALSRLALNNPEAAEGTSFASKYTLPTDFFEVFPEDTHLDDEEFLIEGGCLLCDLEAPVWLRFVRQMPDPAQWDPAFSEVLSWRLAMEMQPELAPAVSPLILLAGFESALKQAHRSGAIEPRCPVSQGFSWEVARR